MRLLEFHRSLLSDQSGQEAYRRAIFYSAKAGRSVLDLGTGTGIHALFACQAGASPVYAIDQHEFIEVARQICSANGCGGRIEFIQRAAEEVSLPEKVDVVVAHHGLPFLLDLMPMARDRFLKPGGTLIPQRIEFFAAPLESEAAYGEAIRYWEEPHLDLTFASVRPYAVNNMHQWRIAPQELIGAPVSLGSIDFYTLQDPAFSGAAQTTVSRSGTLHGVGMWFVQWLAPGVCITTAPPCTLPADLWENEFLPIEPPHAVEAGDRVSLRLHTGTGGWGKVWKWEVDVADGRGQTKARFSHSSFLRHLVTKDMLRKHALDYQPGLTARGAAVRFVLEACDGNHALKWIEEEVVRRFPDGFSSQRDASSLVAHVVARYAK